MQLTNLTGLTKVAKPLKSSTIAQNQIRTLPDFEWCRCLGSLPGSFPLRCQNDASFLNSGWSAWFNLSVLQVDGPVDI